MSEEEEEDNEYLGSVNPSVSPSVKTRLASVPTATPAQYNSPTNNTKHAQQKKQYTRHEAHASPLEDAPIRHETCDPCACLTVSCRVFFKRKTHAQDAARQHFLLAFLGCLFLCLMFVLMFLVAYLRSPAKTRRFDTPLSEQTRPPNSRLCVKKRLFEKGLSIGKTCRVSFYTTSSNLRHPLQRNSSFSQRLDRTHKPVVSSCPTLPSRDKAFRCLMLIEWTTFCCAADPRLRPRFRADQSGFAPILMARARLCIALYRKTEGSTLRCTTIMTIMCPVTRIKRR